MKTDLQLADFVISAPYQLTSADEKCIEETSHGHPAKEDWSAARLKNFKKRVKEYYYEQQNQKCAYCRMDVSLATGFFHIEHIVPKSTHPKWMYTPFNLCLSCPNCNSSKGNQEVLAVNNIGELPHTSSDYLIVHPHIDNYFEHIEIIDGLLYKGLTPKGVKTIEICNLTRTELLAERAKNHIKSEQAEGSYAKMLISNNPQLVENMNDLLGRIQKTMQLLNG